MEIYEVVIYIPIKKTFSTNNNDAFFLNGISLGTIEKVRDNFCIKYIFLSDENLNLNSSKRLVVKFAVELLADLISRVLKIETCPHGFKLSIYV